MPRSLLSWLRGRSGRSPARQPAGRRRSFVPRLLVLEDRTLPSTFLVSNLADSGAGSLRQSVLDANRTPGANQIVFASGLKGTIALTSGELDITNALTITGPGANRIAVSGSDASRVFDIAAGVTAEIDGLTITHGRATQGGGIGNAGSLTLIACTLSANQAQGAPGSLARGGGILNTGTLTVEGSTFSANLVVGGSASAANSSTGQGGGLAGFGGTLTVSHSTFSDNRAIGGAGDPGVAGSNGAGGDLWNGGGSVLTVTYSTFSDNQAIGGAGGRGARRAGPFIPLEQAWRLATAGVEVCLSGSRMRRLVHPEGCQPRTDDPAASCGFGLVGWRRAPFAGRRRPSFAPFAPPAGSPGPIGRRRIGSPRLTG